MPREGESIHPMAFIGKVTENVRYVQDAAKKTQTTRRKITQMKLNAQTVSRTIWLSQDLLTFIKERGNTRGEAQKK